MIILLTALVVLPQRLYSLDTSPYCVHAGLYQSGDRAYRASGCGKTTFLRALNRMHDLTPGAEVQGHAPAHSPEKTLLGESPGSVFI